VEIPDLSVSTIWSFEDHVSVVNEIKVSVVLHFRNDVEWSLNVKSELLVEFSLLWILWILISIDEVPLLFKSIVLVIDHDVSALGINGTLDSEHFTVVIDNVSILVSEQLPPS